MCYINWDIICLHIDHFKKTYFKNLVKKERNNGRYYCFSKYKKNQIRNKQSSKPSYYKLMNERIINNSQVTIYLFIYFFEKR